MYNSEGTLINKEDNTEPFSFSISSHDPQLTNVIYYPVESVKAQEPTKTSKRVRNLDHILEKQSIDPQKLVGEKYKDTHGQIYYHLYDYKAAPIQYSSRYGKGFVNKCIIVSIRSATVYGDTIYWTSMRFLTSAMNFDATTYRKIIHSVRIR